jgi:hypothetical protein
MKLFLSVATLALISGRAYSDFIAKDCEKAMRPSQWKVGDVLEGEGKVTSIETKERQVSC